VWVLFELCIIIFSTFVKVDIFIILCNVAFLVARVGFYHLFAYVVRCFFFNRMIDQLMCYTCSLLFLSFFSKKWACLSCNVAYLVSSSLEVSCVYTVAMFISWSFTNHNRFLPRNQWCGTSPPFVERSRVTTPQQQHSSQASK